MSLVLASEFAPISVRHRFRMAAIISTGGGSHHWCQVACNILCDRQVDKFVTGALLVPVDDFSDSDYDYEESGEV